METFWSFVLYMVTMMGGFWMLSLACAAYAIWAVRGTTPAVEDIIRVSLGYNPRPRLAQPDRAQGSEP